MLGREAAVSSPTKNERQSISKSGADRLKCDSTSSSRMADKSQSGALTSAHNAMNDDAGSLRAVDSNLSRSVTIISGVVMHDRQSKGNPSVKPYSA